MGQIFASNTAHYVCVMVIVAESDVKDWVVHNLGGFYYYIHYYDTCLFDYS